MAAVVVQEAPSTTGNLAWLRHVAVAFVLSRVLMLGIFTLVPMISSVPASQWNDRDVSIRVSAQDVVEGMRRLAYANDASWYLGIAKDGYEKRAFDTTRAANWAFFPMHPTLWRGSASVTGEWFWSGVLMANALFFAGLCLLWHLAKDLLSSDQAADDAVLFAAFWPTSYFASLPQTEALFFTLATLSLLAATRRQWWLVGLGGLIGGAIFLSRRAKHAAQEIYSDAGGMLRLNLEDLNTPPQTSKMLGRGED